MMQISAQFLWTLVPYLVPAGAFAIPLALVCAVALRVRGLRKAVRKCEKSIQAEAAQLTNAVNELKHKFTEFEKQGAIQAQTEPQEAGLGDIARGKVLKMHRVGRAPEQIAQSLGLPKGEVDLLIKVHKIIMRPYEGVSPAERLGA